MIGGRMRAIRSDICSSFTNLLKTMSAGLLVAAMCFLIGCSNEAAEDDARWTDFIERLMISIRTGSEFQREVGLVTTPEEMSELERLAEYPFEFSRCEWLGTSRECYVDFADGTGAVLYMHLAEDKVDELGIGIYPADPKSRPPLSVNDDETPSP